MTWVFEIEDKTGRKIHLSDERWKHLNQEHPEVAPYLEDIKETLKTPLKITAYEYDENVKYYYKYFKEREVAKYLLVIVKYLNNHGFIVTAYFVKNIK
ncbi:hypothetical protein HYX06_03365 [Candidatus Woesearchaeota archaeon]|nr:hypothetical protein [Candidatus Woesearchaeota archaeon]